MTTLKFQADIGNDGVLRLNVPAGLKPGPAEVVVVVQANTSSTKAKKARSGLFQGKPAVSDPDQLLAGMNRDWQNKLTDLGS